MKLIGIILSLYILGLNITPCNDAVEKAADSKIEVSAQINDFHDDQNHFADLCPPFCQCHCCHVHTIHFSSNFEILMPKVSSATFLDFEKQERDYHKSLLQPPRL